MNGEGEAVRVEDGAFSRAMAALRHDYPERDAMGVAVRVADACTAYFREQGLEYNAGNVVSLTAAVLAYAKRGSR